MSDDTDPKGKTLVEEFEIAGRNAVARVQDLIEEGNIRRLIIKNQEDKVLLEIPLTAGVAVGTGALVFAPFYAAVGVAVALFTKVKIEVIRNVSELPVSEKTDTPADANTETPTDEVEEN